MLGNSSLTEKLSIQYLCIKAVGWTIVGLISGRGTTSSGPALSREGPEVFRGYKEAETCVCPLASI